MGNFHSKILLESLWFPWPACYSRPVIDQQYSHSESPWPVVYCGVQSLKGHIDCPYLLVHHLPRQLDGVSSPWSWAWWPWARRRGRSSDCLQRLGFLLGLGQASKTGCLFPIAGETSQRSLKMCGLHVGPVKWQCIIHRTGNLKLCYKISVTWLDKTWQKTN